LYNSERNSINNDLIKDKSVIGGVVPHAGYIFSGYEAVHVFELLRLSGIQYDTVVIINPNHSAWGNDISVDNSEAWRTPFGEVPINSDFASELPFPQSATENKNEHSGEVMMPFLQYFLNYDFSIVPLVMTSQTFDAAKRIADNLYELSKRRSEKIAIIASSDFSHFVSPKKGEQMDDMVLEHVKNFNTQGIEQTVIQNRITVCGYGPIMALTEYTKRIAGKPGVEILKRGNSSKAYPSNEVVDYVSILYFDTSHNN
jgi:hypothetical protein